MSKDIYVILDKRGFFLIAASRTESQYSFLYSLRATSVDEKNA